jgi:hypothetical protein
MEELVLPLICHSFASDMFESFLHRKNKKRFYQKALYEEALHYRALYDEKTSTKKPSMKKSFTKKPSAQKPSMKKSVAKEPSAKERCYHEETCRGANLHTPRRDRSRRRKMKKKHDRL